MRVVMSSPGARVTAELTLEPPARGAAVQALVARAVADHDRAAFGAAGGVLLDLEGHVRRAQRQRDGRPLVLPLPALACPLRGRSTAQLIAQTFAARPAVTSASSRAQAPRPPTKPRGSSVLSSASSVAPSTAPSSVSSPPSESGKEAQPFCRQRAGRAGRRRGETAGRRVAGREAPPRSPTGRSARAPPCRSAPRNRDPSHRKM